MRSCSEEFANLPRVLECLQLRSSVSHGTRAMPNRTSRYCPGLDPLAPHDQLGVRQAKTPTFHVTLRTAGGLRAHHSILAACDRSFMQAALNQRALYAPDPEVIRDEALNLRDAFLFGRVRAEISFQRLEEGGVGNVRLSRTSCRLRAGLRNARAKGKKFGRPR